MEVVQVEELPNPDLMVVVVAGLEKLLAADKSMEGLQLRPQLGLVSEISVVTAQFRVEVEVEVELVKLVKMLVTIAPVAMVCNTT